MSYELIVVGGGPAGLAAAYEAYNNGIKKILILERDNELGGILNQCIHNGFGLHTFKEELTGPEYASRFIDMVKDTDIEVKLNTMVLEITKDKKVYAINSEEGYMELQAEAVILSMGCRERTRGAINIPGDRPAGVYSAGAAQRYINVEGYMPGKEVLILGSGDIGLIMARRMTLEGAKVKAVVELCPYSNGLNRNIVQCLNDYDIPLYLSHTVVDIVGKERLEKVIIAEVDENRRPIKGTEKEFDVDTLLLSVGLIPENDISFNAGIEGDRRTNGLMVSESMETSADGIFACGNVVHVHDLVDFVTEESKRTGISAARYIKNELKKDKYVNIINGTNVNYTVPQRLDIDDVQDKLTIFMRVNNIYHNKALVVRSGEEVIAKFKRAHLAPSEMEKVVLSKVLLDKIKGDITISLEDGE
ncbi:FAD-dependent pyridine nucleotide-disulfide oxidoreductase [Clostridium sp. DL-VIII]|uniref:NAD(P)/FAD-dependent oxidoreductase n=1 Tax=Clostridium sp. DL-VIII TaxID=641107 RepID=UPI00023AF4FE|nr:FAD-dependent oxidoreductase [Clostridium sp. DL-VIII]EHI97836.1 FAD-dependent pyridine nucleotide-disulfide oxidoreductase [Clostridium sp. DL-VIII]